MGIPVKVAATNILNGPLGTVYDSDGALYTAYFNTGVITKQPINGTAVPYAHGLDGPVELCFGPNTINGSSSTNTLYVTCNGNNSVAQITSNGSVSSFGPTNINPTNPNGLIAPVGIALDNVGNLYVASSGNNTIFQIGSYSSSTNTINYCLKPLIKLQNNILNQPTGITFDSFNNMYISNFRGNTITEYNNSKMVSTFSSSILLNNPFEVVYSSSLNSLIVYNAGNNTYLNIALKGGNLIPGTVSLISV